MERYHIFKLGLAILFYAIYCIRPMLVAGLKIDDSTNTKNSQNDDDQFVFYQGVQGQPGKDFPSFSHIPKTTFSCKELDSGYYADLETDCQVFHICEDGKKISFLCPNGTVFQQSELICEWWFKVNCSNSPNLYEESAEQLREENARRKANRRINDKVNHGAIMRTEEHSSISASQNGRTLNTKHIATDRNYEENSQVYQIGKVKSNSLQGTSKNAGDSNQNFVRINAGNSNLIRVKVKNRNNPKPTATPRKNNNNSDRITLNLRTRPQTVSFNKDNSATLNSFISTVSPNNLQSLTGSKIPLNSKQNSYVSFGTSTNYFEKSTTPKSPIVQSRGSSTYTNSSLSSNSDLKSHISINNNLRTGQLSTVKVIPTIDTTLIPPVHFQANQQGKSRLESSRSFSQSGGTNKISNQSFKNQKLTDAELKSSTSGNLYLPNNTSGSSGLVTTQTTPTTSKVSVQGYSNYQTNSFSNSFGTSFLSTPAPTATVFKNSNIQISTKLQPEPFSSTTPIPNITDGNKLDSGDSDESQVPQETASFYKNSYNLIQPNHKSTSNPYPNHKEIYAEIKEPKFPSTKGLNYISSVTPHYLTTQPINNGKPFLGSQVGTTIRGNFGLKSTTESIITGRANANNDFAKVAFSGYDGIETTTESISTTPNLFTLFNVGNTDKTLPTTVTQVTSTTTLPTPTELFNVGKTDSTLPPLTTSLPEIFFTSTPSGLEVPKIGSFNLGTGVSTLRSPVVESTTRKIVDHATVYGKFIKSNSPVPNSVESTPEIKFTSNKLEITTKLPINNQNGFFVTKSKTSGSTTPRSINEYVYNNVKDTEILKPRPFELPSRSFESQETTTNGPSFNSVEPTYPTYKISSASPFSLPKDIGTVEPTLPTLLTTTTSSVYENIDNMINALVEMANPTKDNLSTGRPGLVVPPSAGPQTLHTLAVYFANALDEIATEKDNGNNENGKTDEISEKDRITALLTQMTMSRYNELFNDKENESTTTTISTDTETETEDPDLEGQHSKNPAQAPNVRKLAKVFTQALSSYLDDPDTFKKVLEEIRPTEPPPLSSENDGVTEIGTSDDELLNFSDADIKSSFPPFYPTLPSIRPTWGYILALNNTYKQTGNLDVKNSLSPELESLHSADSQSFVSQYNNLQISTKRPPNLPTNHWTVSPGVTKLWASTFSVNPASINENFDGLSVTSTISPTDNNVYGQETTPIQPHHEIQYELRALPKLALNSTQVHGILIDFMNTTKIEDPNNRLQRILKKLNTTEDEFLTKMKEIESNPLTRRLILLLISECGDAVDSTPTTPSIPTIENYNAETLETSGSNYAENSKPFSISNSSIRQIVDPSLGKDDKDERALQLLNSLYTIASKFGK